MAKITNFYECRSEGDTCNSQLNIAEYRTIEFNHTGGLHFRFQTVKLFRIIVRTTEMNVLNQSIQT